MDQKTILVTTAATVVLVFQSTTYDYDDNSSLFRAEDISQIELSIGNSQNILLIR